MLEKTGILHREKDKGHQHKQNQKVPKVNGYIGRRLQRILIFPILDILTGHDGPDDAFKNQVSEGGDGDGMANVLPHVYEDLK